jgi:hypothetical protein
MKTDSDSGDSTETSTMTDTGSGIRGFTESFTKQNVKKTIGTPRIPSR